MRQGLRTFSKIFLISICLICAGCLWSTGNGALKAPPPGKIILPPEPQTPDIPEYKVVKPKQGMQPSNSGGVFFPYSAFSVLEYNIKSLRSWMTDAKSQVKLHNDSVDKRSEEIKKSLEKKGWLW